VGIVFVLLLGEIDLSVGAVSGLASAVTAVQSAKHGWSAYTAIGGRNRRRPGVGADPGIPVHAVSASRRSWSPSPGS